MPEIYESRALRGCAQGGLLRSLSGYDVSVGRHVCGARANRADGLDDQGMKRRYTDQHAGSGLDSELPDIETWLNQFKGYEITIEVPEYTAICPKTGLPDFGTIRVTYLPDKRCLELKSLKMYIHAYRNVGIFYENAVNRILKDIVSACRPVRAVVTGEFTARAGLRSTIHARYPYSSPYQHRAAHPSLSPANPKHAR